jgi:hypothetical protein
MNCIEEFFSDALEQRWLTESIVSKLQLLGHGLVATVFEGLKFGFLWVFFKIRARKLENFGGR